MDAAGEFFDELATNSLDTAVSDGGGEGFPLGKMSKDQKANKKKGMEEKCWARLCNTECH